MRCVGEGSLVVYALEGNPFIASCHGLNLCLGVGWVFTGCVGKNVGMLGSVGRGGGWGLVFQVLEISLLHFAPFSTFNY